MTRAVLCVALAGAFAPVMLAWAATPTIISQSRRSFSVKEIAIKANTAIRFSNADEFIHHIYVKSPSFSFNSGEQEPGRDIDVAFPVAGKFEVRCEIHPKMLLTVTVQ